jgi:two-component system, OmpR family, sensor kinase
VTFRVRTALFVFVLTTVTMGAAFAGVWDYFVSEQQRHLDDALLIVAHRSDPRREAGDLEFTDAPGPFANAVGPLPKYGVLYEIDGQPLSHTKNLTSIPPMPLVPYDVGFDLEHDGMHMRGVVIAVGKTGRRVLMASPRDDLDDDARMLSRAMMLAFAVGCVWASVVAFVVATRLTREHRIVGDVARRVASGDTSARIAFRSSDADLRQLATDLNKMIEQLTSLLSAQERFISHAAHELRTPLTSLRIEVEHALRTRGDRGDYESALEGALESTRRLTDLAEDLLQLARLKAEPSEEFAPLEEPLDDAIADVAPLGRLREVLIVSESLPATVRGDRRGLARLLRNVLENAVRFSPRGGRVGVKSRIDHERILISVTDEGPGIVRGEEERIFEPFARGGRSDGPEGTGLGLSIARGLARSFGGDVAVERGDGGRFVIELQIWNERSEIHE